MHTHPHTCIYAHERIYIMKEGLQVCIHIQMHVCMQINVYNNERRASGMHTHPHTCMYPYKRVYIMKEGLQVCIHIHIPICMHVNLYERYCQSQNN